MPEPKPFQYKPQGSNLRGAPKPISIDGFDEQVIATQSETTGWAVYRDTQYTEASPLLLTDGVGGIALPNNAGIVLDSQKPVDVASFYDPVTKKIAGRAGDGLVIVVDLVAKPTSASLKSIDVWVDIGGTVGRTYQNTITLPKGSGVANRLSLTMPVYTLDTWESNGGILYLQVDHNCSVYDIRYIFHRIHKAR
jgi:hypothetical protein